MLSLVCTLRPRGNTNEYLDVVSQDFQRTITDAVEQISAVI